MDRGMVIFVGALLTFSSSWLGLVLYPYWQLQNEQPYSAGPTEDPYPRKLEGKALAGMKVYQANGCMYCHSQQVRSEKFGNWWENGEQKTGADIKRGWGARRTVSRDYIHDRPTMLGTMRTGPDLAAIGERNTSLGWHHNHLFNPRSVNAWSIMPSYPFFYTREKVVGARSDKALQIGREWSIDPGYRWKPTDREWAALLANQGDAIKAAYLAQNPGPFDVNTPDGRTKLLNFWLTTPEEGYQIVPTGEGEALVEYLLALTKTAIPLPEAKE